MEKWFACSGFYECLGRDGFMTAAFPAERDACVPLAWGNTPCTTIDSFTQAYRVLFVETSYFSFVMLSALTRVL
jgi:hypothetical protein